MGPVRRACAVAMLVVCGLASGVLPAAATPTTPNGPIGRVTPMSWHRCGTGFQCGTLTVPLDPAAPTGSTLDLAVVRARARHANARIGSLVFNPGGPGAPAVAFLRGMAAAMPAELRDRFDLVAFDPRGVGRSDPVHCVSTLDPLFDQSFEPTTVESRAALVDAVTALASACATRNGPLLSHVSTADAVRDLERLRLALGDAKLSFVGYSYGTLLGASYANAYPDRVRAFVLDSPVDPTMTAAEVTLGQARGFEHALDDFLADCSERPGCAFHHDGDAAGAYDRLRSRAAAAPLPARHAGGRALDEARFDAAVLEELYLGRGAWPTLADALADADRGDASSLLDLADAYVGRGADGHDDHVLESFWAVTCLDGPVIGDVDAARALELRAVSVAPRMGAFIVNNSLPCSVWPVPPVAPPGRLTARGAPPILVIGTTDDPATPFVQARSLAGALQRGHLLVVDAEQHTSFANGNECVDRVVTRYLSDLRLPPVGTRC